MLITGGLVVVVVVVEVWGDWEAVLMLGKFIRLFAGVCLEMEG